ncbi:MAG: creatininase family protein [Candidatus Palauibacterales bacterium]|nr:creatininase family protein [Candidatus Palauibacterales bacterium]
MTVAESSGTQGAVRLDELPWTEVASHLRGDARLLLPIGSTLQHGPHLPLATDSIVVTRLADALSARHGVLVAPTLPYGVVSRVEQEYAGTSSIGRKTLHRGLNDLVGVWETQGVDEFILLTSHGYGPHIAAMATVVSERSRVRSVDIHSVDLGDFLEGRTGEQHGGELETSLMLHLAPDLVRRDEIADAPLDPSDQGRRVVGEEPVPERGSPGVVGTPSLATAEKGRRTFRYLVEFIGDRVLADGSES